MRVGDDYGEEYEDDVDDVVDPLAGLRGADAERGAGHELGTPGAEPVAAESPGMLDLGDEYASYEPIDGEDEEPLPSADRFAADDTPVQARLGGGRRRSLVGGGNDAGAGAGAGSTLFERMANLSRSTAREDEDDDDGDDSPALSSPRFLGRQNNQ
jgi:cell division protein FtsZ